jgi:hypothetical protein
MFLGQGHSLHIQIEPKNTRVAPGTSYDRAASAAQLKPWGRSMSRRQTLRRRRSSLEINYVVLEIAVLSSLPHHSERNAYSAVLLYLLCTSLNMNKIKQVRQKGPRSFCAAAAIAISCFRFGLNHLLYTY